MARTPVLDHDEVRAALAAVAPPPGDGSFADLFAEITTIAVAEAGEAEQAAAGLDRAGGPPVRGRAAIRVVRQSVLVATSEGRIAEERREYWSVRADAVARSGQKVRRSRRVQGARSLDDLCCGGAHLMLAAEVASAALARLDAVEGPSGELAV